MLDVAVKTIITFLVCYAVIDIAIRLIDYMFNSDKQIKDKFFVVVKLFGPEEKLEYIVRSIIWKNLTCSKGGNIPDVLIVDMGCDSNTALIGKKLAEDYPFIYYISKQEFECFIKNFNKLE